MSVAWRSDAITTPFVVRVRLSDSGRSVGVGEGFGEPGEEQVEASVEFGGPVVAGEGGCEGA